MIAPQGEGGKFFIQQFKLLYNYLKRKGVIDVAEKKGDCGCGCIGEKQSKEKTAKSKKKTKKSK
ncbi:hypothetical protein D3OALGA1CA_5265 [Olavius algarvensis associated proteobacterium Delta 3]|nr:hypothetical protein D3OALGB2SA_535 [Olavius algarvensis associated proteobacterium Delta 3]CAB5164259.1 hypothetical protein D3OALGA1CA_5265 [Olavius algarvensis associated proteobacterium Delta 3]